MSNFHFYAEKNVLYKDKYFQEMYKIPPLIQIIRHFCNYVLLRVVHVAYIFKKA